MILYLPTMYYDVELRICQCGLKATSSRRPVKSTLRTATYAMRNHQHFECFQETIGTALKGGASRLAITDIA